MKAAMPAGELGSRLHAETTIRPKPMVEVGGEPVPWHILEIDSTYGYQEFVIALGEKGVPIKDYFLNSYALAPDLAVDLASGRPEVRASNGPAWRVRLVDIGLHGQAGEGWTNGGLFVLEPGMSDLVEGDETVWERPPLERLAAEERLTAYRDDGFWQPMDTPGERRLLEERRVSGSLSGKVW